MREATGNWSDDDVEAKQIGPGEHNPTLGLIRKHFRRFDNDCDTSNEPPAYQSQPD